VPFRCFLAAKPASQLTRGAMKKKKMKASCVWQKSANKNTHVRAFFGVGLFCGFWAFLIKGSSQTPKQMR
jgi:hypothetical protein